MKELNSGTVVSAVVLYALVHETVKVLGHRLVLAVAAGLVSGCLHTWS